METELRRRLRSWIYGADDDTLESVALDTISAYGWQLAVVEANLNGRLTQRLAEADGPFAGGEVLTSAPPPQDLLPILRDLCQTRVAQIGLGVILEPGEFKQTLYIALVTPDEERQVVRSYGGPPAMAPARAAFWFCLIA